MNIYGRVGWRAAAAVNPAPGLDADALAFITAASITDTTQKSAINTLVTQLKTYGIWTKLKAVYPFVGGTASSHKFNLKDPRDLDAAYRLTFNGGGVHSSTGYAGNASNAWANTHLFAQTNLTNSNLHVSFYSRTASPLIAYSGEILVDYSYGSGTQWLALRTNDKTGGGSTYFSAGNDAVNALISNTLSGFFIGSETSNTLRKLYRNGSSIATNTTSDNNALPLAPVTLLGYSAGSNSGNESAFASIGDGLTDTEAANFYTAVQTFQTTLGRHVGVPIVADTDAQAFLNAAVITDSTQATAINTLVTDLKSANIWTKMKAIYPFVGGTATTHKYNLKDPRDVDAAYRLVFNGGWTHSATGALPNGTTAYADTKLNLNTTQPNNTSYLSYYSRTLQNANTGEIGGLDSSTSSANSFYLSYGGTLQGYNGFSKSVSIAGQSNQTQGYYALNAYNLQLKVFKNNTQIGTTTSLTSYNTVNYNLYIGAINNGGVTSYYSNKESAFASIGDGLTDAEAAAFYTAVQAYQTTLSRNV